MALTKRDRLDRLIQLLERLEKGEQCMSFKEFDLSDYINALENFKSNQTETVIQRWGSIENFDMFIQKIKDDEDHVAQLAIQQFGSIEKYTEEMKHNLEHFSEIMEKWQSQITEEMRTEDKFLKLASHKGGRCGFQTGSKHCRRNFNRRTGVRPQSTDRQHRKLL